MLIEKLNGFKDGTGCLKMSRTVGKTLLKNLGFEDCLNRSFMQKNNIYAHYNKIMGIWIIENAKEVKMGIVI